MDEEKKDEAKVESGASDEQGDKKKPVEFSAEQQAILNREIAEAKRKERERVQGEIDAEKERLAKEAREAALLEKENFKQLAEEREKELAALKAELEGKDLDAKTETLLANAGITSSHLRDMVKALPHDLEIRSKYIDNLTATLAEETEKRVAERLHMKAPDKSGGAAGGEKKIASMTAAEKVELRQSIGDAEFTRRVQAERASK